MKSWSWTFGLGLGLEESLAVFRGFCCNSWRQWARHTMAFCGILCLLGHTDASKAQCIDCGKLLSLGSNKPGRQTVHGLKCHLEKCHTLLSTGDQKHSCACGVGTFSSWCWCCIDGLNCDLEQQRSIGSASKVGPKCINPYWLHFETEFYIRYYLCLLMLWRCFTNSPGNMCQQRQTYRRMLFCVTVYSRLKLHRVSDPLQKMDQLPGVSVVKPLMGVDPFLETNLESHFTLTYPKVGYCKWMVFISSSEMLKPHWLQSSHVTSTSTVNVLLLLCTHWRKLS